jgi:hypothetical protein
LVEGVTIALGTHPLTERMPFDSDGSGSVTVEELVGAVNNALNECGRRIVGSRQTSVGSVQ